MNDNEMVLKYGCNPHQTPARVYAKGASLPIKSLSGQPGYINLLDALNSWQLVKELKRALDLPAAASFKHVSPAGAAVGIPLTEILRKIYFVGDLEISPLASAYARARGADRISSFGDWIAISDEVDKSTAILIKREVSDGIIAPAYSPEAFEILKQKKKGRFIIIEVDPDYKPDEIECRDVFGVRFEQKRNTALMNPDLLKNIVTENKTLTDSARRDITIALTTLKYTQSNSVCLVSDGQVIGSGAGQQSRIHCTRLAASKADTWFLRQHPAVLNLRFKQGIRRPVRDNAIDLFLREDLSLEEEKVWEKSLDEIPKRLSPEEKHEWLKNLTGVSLGSDGFFPFRDNIDRASQSGVRYIVQPGGSLRDEDVIQACNEYGMVMAFSNLRLFHH